MFKALTILVDHHVAFGEVAKLSLKVDGALDLVVAEHAFNVGPGGEGDATRLVDHVEDFFANGAIKPVGDAAVDRPTFVSTKKSKICTTTYLLACPIFV